MHSRAIELLLFSYVMEEPLLCGGRSNDTQNRYETKQNETNLYYFLLFLPLLVHTFILLQNSQKIPSLNL